MNPEYNLPSEVRDKNVESPERLIVKKLVSMAALVAAAEILMM